MASDTLSPIYPIFLAVRKGFCMTNGEYMFDMKDYSFFGFEFVPILLLSPSDIDAVAQ